MKIKISTILVMLTFSFSLAQVNKKEIEHETKIIIEDSLKVTSGVLMFRNPLKASLYSALLPGVGQLYNRKWIKAPIALGLVAVGTGFTLYYNGLYKKYRNAFIDVRDGSDSEYNNLSAEQLAVIQDNFKRQRDYAVALTILAYLLNIVDATVDAHLYTISKDKDMTLKPSVIQNQISIEPVLGLAFNFKF